MNPEILTQIYLPSVMSLFLAFIAYQQLTTNRKKLKLDLYNKRFEVYSVALRFYQEFVGDRFTNETALEFINSKNASEFLFSKDPAISKLMDEMHARSFKISQFPKLQDAYKNNPEALMNALNVRNETLTWFDLAIKDLHKLMKPHLSM